MVKMVKKKIQNYKKKSQKIFLKNYFFLKKSENSENIFFSEKKICYSLSFVNGEDYLMTRDLGRRSRKSLCLI